MVFPCFRRAHTGAEVGDLVNFHLFSTRSKSSIFNFWLSPFVQIDGMMTAGHKKSSNDCVKLLSQFSQNGTWGLVLPLGEYPGRSAAHFAQRHSKT